MSGREVVAVVRALAAAGINAAVAGGWGVDALLGRQTRAHRDLDLGLPADRLEEALAVLARRGYRITVDQRPVRVEVAAAGGRVVDLHPIRWTDDGTGYQHGFDGRVFVYPVGSLDAEGRIGGRPVRCATVQLQLEFHSGYEPGPHDRADVELLVAEFGLPRPAGYGP